MIEGTVDLRGVPTIEVELAGRTWVATIDTGFNGFLELPDELFGEIPTKFLGKSTSTLAGGHVVREDEFFVRFPFDGQLLSASATFAPGDGILIGTRLIKNYVLTVDFLTKGVWLERA